MIKGLGGFGDMAKMMKAAKDMQDRMQKDYFLRPSFSINRR